MAAPIGLQLCSVHEALARDQAGTLRRIAEMGYLGVETDFFGRLALTCRGSPGRCAISGCRSSPAHVELPAGEFGQQVVRHGRELGCSRLVWHGWPRDPRDDSLAGIKQCAAEYAEAAKSPRTAASALGCTTIGGR